MKTFTKTARALVHALGFELTRLKSVQYAPHGNILGTDAFGDIQRILAKEKAPVIFDIGANSGQSVQTFKELFSDSVIHSFEPSPAVFEQLAENVKGYENVTINQLAVGQANEAKILLENTQSEMTSFLLPGEMGWGKVERETIVNVVTLDDYCAQKGITFVNLLKIDTQGFEFEVLKGCQRLMNEDQIQMIYMEVNFAELYVGLPAFDEMFRFLLDNKFGLVSFYGFAHQGHLASWSDALFLNKTFQQPLVPNYVFEGAV